MNNDKVVNELKTIRIQGEIRDHKKEYGEIQTRRKKDLGRLIQGLGILIVPFVFCIFSFYISINANQSEFSIPSFLPSFGWIGNFLLIVISTLILLVDVFLLFRIIKSSKRITELKKLASQKIKVLRSLD